MREPIHPGEMLREDLDALDPEVTCVRDVRIGHCTYL